MTTDPSDKLFEFAVCYARTECSGSLISEHKLRSACGRPFQTFDGSLLHPTVVSQAAGLLEGIVLAHAFDDGNKRTGWMTLIYFLACHRQTLRDISDAEGEEVVVSVVTHNLPLADFAGWIAQHLVPLTE